MAVNKLKKINVRSPYYISVAKPVSEGGEGDEPDVIPTEPVDREQSIECGDNYQVGVDVGRRRYKISLEGKLLGDYTIALSGVTVPIQYRIGHASNMPSFSIAGTDEYQSEFQTATGHDGSSLSSASANPNGVSVNATYTSTQSDIDTYGNEIELEVLQPLVTEGYSFSLSCPSFATETNAVSSVLVVSLIRTRANAVTGATITMNGTSLGNEPGYRQYSATRYVFDTSSPDIAPEQNGGFHNRNDVAFATSYENDVVLNIGGITAVHKSPAILRGSQTNTLVIKNTSGFTHNYRVIVSKHTVEEVNGVKYIRGSSAGFDAKAIISEFSFGNGQTYTMNFTGSNTEDLATGEVTMTIRAAGDGADGFDEIPLTSSLITINKL